MNSKYIKLILIFIFLFNLAACKNNDQPKQQITTEEAEKPAAEQKIETIVKNDYGNMNENWGIYDPLLNKPLIFETNETDYHYDRLAIKFDEELNVDLNFQTHLSGKFTYYYKNKEYILNLNTILIGYSYHGVDDYSYFFIEVDNNEIRYTLRGNAKLEIDQIWRFIPNESE